MIDATLFVASLFVTVSVMLTIACVVCLIEFRNNERVKDVWWNPLILNISTAFTPTVRLITCIPLGLVSWIVSNRWKACFVGTVYAVWIWTGGATGAYIHDLNLMYRNGFQLTVRHLMEQIVRTIGIIWATFIMLYNWFVIAGLSWIAALWDILGACGSDVSVWLQILTCPFRALGSFFGAFHSFFFNSDNTLYSSWLVTPFDITPAIGELQNGLVVFGNELDCLCQGLKPAISAAINCFADIHLADAGNAFLNIFISIAQALFRMVSNDFSNLDIGPVFNWWNTLCYSFGTWLDMSMSFILNGLSGEFGRNFVIPKPYVFASFARVLSAAGGFVKIPLMMLIALVQQPNSPHVMYEATNMHEPFTQLDIAVAGFSQSAQWTFEMSKDTAFDAASLVLPGINASWPSHTGPLQCDYWSLNYYKTVQDKPTECHCSKSNGCGTGGTCNAMTGYCTCREGYISLYPSEYGLNNLSPYRCIEACTNDLDCVGISKGTGTCGSDGYCTCSSANAYNTETGKCELASLSYPAHVVNNVKSKGPPTFDWRPDTCPGDTVTSVGPAFGCIVQSTMRAAVGVTYVSLNFAREFAYNLEQDIVHANLDGLAHIYALLENSDGHWYPRSASVSCEYRKSYDGDCTTYQGNCGCQMNVSDPTTGTYSPYCLNPTLNANVYSHLDALGFYSGMAFWPSLFDNNIGVMITSAIRLFVEVLRVSSRVATGTAAFVHDLVGTIISRIEDKDVLAALNIIADLEDNLANVPTNCRWGIPFQGPIFPVVSYDPAMDKNALLNRIQQYNTVAESETRKYCNGTAPASACDTYRDFLAWSSAYFPGSTAPLYALDAVRQMNNYHLLEAMYEVSEQCVRNHHWCEARRSGFTTPACGSKHADDPTPNNNDDCYCSIEFDYQSDYACKCMPYFSTLEYTIQGVNQGSYHDEMYARLFSKETVPRCNSMVLEWVFYRAGEFFVGMEQAIDLLENNDPLEIGETGRCYDVSKEYQIVHKSSLDSMYEPMTPVLADGTVESPMIGVRNHKSFSPCGIIGTCGNCWCKVWVSDEFVCDVGMTVRQFSWTILNIMHEITTVGIGIVTVGAGATDISVPARLCDAQRTVGAATAGLSALIGMTSHLITADTERRIASTIFTLTDIFVFVPVAFMDSIVISVKQLVRSPFTDPNVIGAFIVNTLVTFVRTEFVMWCQFLLGIDRAVNGIQQDGVIQGSQIGRDSLLGPLLQVSNDFIKIIDELMEDIGLLIVQVTLGFINVLVGAGDESALQFFSAFIDLIEKVAALIARDYMKWMRALFTVLPEPFSTVLKATTSIECMIVYGALGDIRDVVFGIIDVINIVPGVSISKPNWPDWREETLHCIDTFDNRQSVIYVPNPPNQPTIAPGPTPLFPPSPVGWDPKAGTLDDDGIGLDDDPSSRRLGEKAARSYEDNYVMLRSELDWNGTSVCSQLGRMKNAPSTDAGKVIYADCVRRRVWSKYLNRLINRTYIPSSIFDDWNNPIEFGALVMRSFVSLISKDTVDLRYLEQSGYPVDAARDLHNALFSAGLGVMDSLRPTELRKAWVPNMFPDYKKDNSSVGATIDRIFERIEDAPPANISSRDVTKAADAVGKTYTRIKNQIWPPVQIPSPAPTQAVAAPLRFRRRLVETTGAGMPLPSQSIGVSSIPCPDNGYCTHCAVLDSFLGRIMNVTYNVGDYYANEYVNACNTYSRFMARPDDAPNNYPRIATTSNNVHPGPAPARPGVNKTLGSSGGPLFELLHRTGDLKDALSAFFINFDCTPIPVFEKSLWCYASQPFKPCTYEKTAVTSCKVAQYSIGDSLRIVAYTWLGIEVFGLVTTVYIPAVIRYPVFFAAYLMARYDYSFRCFPVMPYCLFRDFEWVIDEIFPMCFCDTFRANLLPGSVCDTSTCSSFKADTPDYQDCPAQDLGPLWAPLFFLRWQAPSVFAFLFNSGWSPLRPLRSSSPSIEAMLAQIAQHVSVTRYEANCFYIQVPVALAVFMLVPMAITIAISLVFAILPLIRVAIVQTVMAGYFVLDEIPGISLERAKQRGIDSDSSIAVDKKKEE